MVKKIHKKIPKLKKGAWFYKVRGSYLPGSWQGWLTYIPYSIILIGTLVRAIESKLAVYELVLLVLPVWILAAVVMTWIAARKS